MKVETYQLFASNGKPIRKATKIIFDDGRELRLMELLPKRLAIRQAKRLAALRLQEATDTGSDLRRRIGEP